VAASYRPALPQRRGWHYSARDGVVIVGMVAQGRWRRRRRTSVVRRHGAVLGKHRTGVRPFSRVPPSSFEGAVRWPYEWAAQCHGADTGLPPQCRKVAGMASPGELAEQRQDMIPMRVRGTAQCGFVFDPGACKCQNIKCPCRGSRYGGGDLVRVSSEAEPHSRGAAGPRARRNLTRGGDRPSSEFVCVFLRKKMVSPSF
jgi:hypothetical protein